MEDHKRKNKKRNQNKRPTQEQIKKIQGNVDQRKEKTNGAVENGVIENFTNSLQNEGRPHNGNEVAVEHHVNGENNGKEIKKPKRKNKQKANQKDCQDEDQIVNDQTQDLNQANINIIVDEVVKTLPITTKEPPQAMHVNESDVEHNNGNGLSPQQCSNVSTPCHQYHNNEAPTCSHHIQHHNMMNDLKMGNLKIDFDVQKHLSPMGTQAAGSNKEYFYKGFNVEQLAAGCNGDGNGNPLEVDVRQQFKHANGIEDEKQKPLAFPNLSHQMSETSGGNLPVNSPLLFNPEEMLKSMLGNPSSATDTNEMLKNMFSAVDKSGAAAAPPNTNDIFKNIFGNVGSSGTVTPDPNEMLKNMFGNSGLPNPEEILKSMSGNSNASPNPNEMLKNMFCNSENEDGSIEFNPQDMFSQVNTMMQNMDPNMMSSMNQMMSSMDPTILAGMTNMVAGMMQGGGLDLHNLMQMKANKLQNSKNNSNNEVENEEICEDKIKSNTSNEDLERSKADIEERKESQQVPISPQVKVVELKTQDEPQMKCNFSFSSNSSEKTEGDEEDTTTEIDEPKERDEINKESIIRPKIKRFEREESIPELLENLIKQGTKKEVTKTSKVEVKTNKIKTILSKVLKKEKKTVSGDSSVQSIEIHEHCVEYQNTKVPKKSETNVQSIDYEKLQHVKEPLEVPEKREAHLQAKVKEAKPTPRRVKDIKDTVANEKLNFKETGEQTREREVLIPSGDKENTNPLDCEFNIENMNELFTNLLQGKKLGEINSISSGSNTESHQFETNSLANVLNNSFQSENNGPVNGNTPLAMMMQQNMTSMFGNFIQAQNSKTDSDINEVSESLGAQKLGNIENLMSQMLGGISTSNSQQKERGNVTSSPADLMRQFNNTDTSSSPKENLMASLNGMFDQLLPNNAINTDSDLSNMLSNPENVKSILKIGEMLFGKSPFDLEDENYQTLESGDNVNDNPDEIVEEDKINTPSKNFYQDERPSVLLKELLGEKFWSIRKKRNDLVENSNSKSKRNKNKQKEKCKPESVDNPIQAEKAECSKTNESKTSSDSVPSDFCSELEKESPFVRMMHKKLQKDSKLQQFLKTKLQKDPKMQKFIQDRLLKDEKFQKFIQEKLSKNKEMRQNFQEKFKNELGLTIDIPELDDDEDKQSVEIVNENVNESNDRCNQVDNPKENTDSVNIVDENLSRIPESVAHVDPDDSEEKKLNTGLLIKKYAELTMMLVGIVYMGILCY